MPPKNLRVRFAEILKCILIFVFAFFSIYAIVYLFQYEKRLRLPLLPLEVVCVTGLPARTARTFVPPFFAPKSCLAHFPWQSGDARLSIRVGLGLK